MLPVHMPHDRHSFCLRVTHCRWRSTDGLCHSTTTLASSEDRRLWREHKTAAHAAARAEARLDIARPRVVEALDHHLEARRIFLDPPHRHLMLLVRVALAPHPALDRVRAVLAVVALPAHSAVRVKLDLAAHRLVAIVALLRCAPILSRLGPRTLRPPCLIRRGEERRRLELLDHRLVALLFILPRRRLERGRQAQATVHGTVQAQATVLDPERLRLLGGREGL